MIACQSNSKEDKPNQLRQIRNTEARDDSLKMADALNQQSIFENKVSAMFETQACEATKEQDAADDPCIYVSPSDSSKSMIIGTNKKSGLEVYDMQGHRIQHFTDGKINNVDLRDAFLYQGKQGALVAASNRSKNAITFYFIDYQFNQLSNEIYSIPSQLDEVYGLCMYHNPKTNKFYVFVNGKNRNIEQWQISWKKDHFEHALVRSLSVKSQAEGMEADDQNGMLYIGVEEDAVYSVSALPDAKEAMKKIKGSDQSNPNIAYDLEGLSVFEYQGKSYLLVSSQGNFSYAIFELGSNEHYLGSFIIQSQTIDGVEETDGLDIANYTYNGRCKNGILVTQDGFNTQGDSLTSQNFKIISMDEIVPLLK